MKLINDLAEALIKANKIIDKDVTLLISDNNLKNKIDKILIGFSKNENQKQTDKRYEAQRYFRLQVSKVPSTRI